MSLALKLLHAWPVLGDLAATVRGWQLNRQRYRAVYHRTLTEFEERNTWPLERLLEYQQQRLQALVAGAAHHVPYYRRLFAERGLRPADIQTVADLPKLPPLDKHKLRHDPHDLVDERCDPRRLVRSQTSGTSGVPVQLYADTDALQQHYALYEVRCRRAAGMHFGRDPYVMLGARAVVSPRRTRPPFWIYNHAWKQLYMSIYHLADQHLPAYIDALRARPYQAIMGFPFPIYLLARHAVHMGCPPLPIEAAITSGEVLRPEWRATIERGLGCRVFNQYGCAEQCVFAAECPHGGMHLSIDTCVVEVVDDEDRPVPVGQSGHLLCTGLLNTAQPLIRYRIGDRAALSGECCPCGSPLPLIHALEGRSGDELQLPDGRRVSFVSSSLVMAGLETVAQWQLVQEALDHVVLRVVAESEFTAEDERRLRDNLRRELGDVRIDIERVDTIERTAAGKAILFVSKLNKPAAPSA